MKSLKQYWTPLIFIVWKKEFLKTSLYSKEERKVIQVWNDMRTDDTFYYLFNWYSAFLFKFTFILKTDMWKSIHTFRGILVLLILMPRDVDLRRWKHPSLFFITTPYCFCFCTGKIGMGNKFDNTHAKGIIILPNILIPSLMFHPLPVFWSHSFTEASILSSPAS